MGGITGTELAKNLKSPSISLPLVCSLPGFRVCPKCKVSSRPELPLMPAGSTATHSRDRRREKTLIALPLLSLELPFPPHSLPNNHLKTGSGGAILKCRGGTFCIGYFCQFVYLCEVTTSGRRVSYVSLWFCSRFCSGFDMVVLSSSGGSRWCGCSSARRWGNWEEGAAGIFWVSRIFEDLCKSVRFASPQGGRARTGVEALLPPASPSSSFFS